jgi:hypothetical protein
MLWCPKLDARTLDPQETWLVSEFCDKGNLDRALSGGRFHDRATGAPEMVSAPSLAHPTLGQAPPRASAVHVLFVLHLL